MRVGRCCLRGTHGLGFWVRARSSSNSGLFAFRRRFRPPLVSPLGCAHLDERRNGRRPAQFYSSYRSRRPRRPSRRSALQTAPLVFFALWGACLAGKSIAGRFCSRLVFSSFFWIFLFKKLQVVVRTAGQSALVFAILDS